MVNYSHINFYYFRWNETIRVHFLLLLFSRSGAIDLLHNGGKASQKFLTKNEISFDVSDYEIGTNERRSFRTGEFTTQFLVEYRVKF